MSPSAAVASEGLGAARTEGEDVEFLRLLGSISHERQAAISVLIRQVAELELRGDAFQALRLINETKTALFEA